MKRFLALTLTGVLALSLLSGCAKDTGGAAPSASPTTSTAPVAPAEKKALKTGLSLLTTVSGADAGEKNGKVESEILAAAVLVAEDGTVAACRLDMLQAKLEITATGTLATDPSIELSTKVELGDKYGMKKASKIGKEWYEQAQAFEAWTVGKTAAQLTGAVGADGIATDTDLVAGCTVHVSDYVKAVVMAMEGARDLGASQGDLLGLSIIASASDSKPADAKGDGSVKLEAFVSAVSVDEARVITSEAIDGTQPSATFTIDGKVTVPAAEVPSKYQLGDNYGMKKASKIGKEWYEQMDAFSAGMVGRSEEGVAAAVGEDGLAADADLMAGCTVHVSDQVKVTIKAIASAR